VAADELRRRGAFLGDRRGDLVSYLAVVGCRAAVGYDADRSRPGYSFASYLYDVMKMRLVDYYRSRGEGFVDRRHWREHESLPVNLVGDRVEVLEAVYGDRPDEALALTSDADFEDAADELGSELSPEGRWALEALARPLAEGYSLTEAAIADGVTLHRARLALEELREELEGQRLVA
jgi:hypothetical protein